MFIKLNWENLEMWHKNLLIIRNLIVSAMALGYQWQNHIFVCGIQIGKPIVLVA